MLNGVEESISSTPMVGARSRSRLWKTWNRTPLVFWQNIILTFKKKKHMFHHWPFLECSVQSKKLCLKIYAISHCILMCGFLCDSICYFLYLSHIPLIPVWNSQQCCLCLCLVGEIIPVSPLSESPNRVATIHCPWCNGLHQSPIT